MASPKILILTSKDGSRYPAEPGYSHCDKTDSGISKELVYNLLGYKPIFS